MNSLETAKLTLEDSGYSCVIASAGKVVFTSQGRGIGPLVEYYHRYGEAHPGAALADKVVGRAAALLARLIGIGEVYTDVISQGALEELNKADVAVSYETKVDVIRNRAGTGLCPMEQLSKGVEDPREMLQKAEDFLAQMKKG